MPHALTLKRYPTWLQLMLLPWLPIIAVLMVFTMPRSETLVCVSGACVLEVAKGASTQRYPVRDFRFDQGTQNVRPDMVAEIDGPHGRELRRYASPDEHPLTSTPVDRFNAREGVAVREELLRPTWWQLFSFLGAFEVALIFFFAVKQRVIRVDVEPETGAVNVAERDLVIRSTEKALNLGDVDDFVVDISDRTFIVAATKTERVKLFEASGPEAASAIAYLSAALASFRKKADSLA